MSAYHTFSTARTTTPDRVAMVANLKAALADPSAVLALVGDEWRGKKNTAWTAEQIATAQTVLDTAPEFTTLVEAQRTIDSYPIHLRALVLTLIDELNTLRDLHGLAPRTPQQAITAIRNKAATLS